MNASALKLTVCWCSLRLQKLKHSLTERNRRTIPSHRAVGSCPLYNCPSSFWPKIYKVEVRTINSHQPVLGG